MDNLASATYETFERDPVKYERYEEVGNISLHWIFFLNFFLGRIPGSMQPKSTWPRVSKVECPFSFTYNV